MQARAYVRGISMSPRKMRVVANVVRNKKVEEAVGLLDLMPKRAAGGLSQRASEETSSKWPCRPSRTLPTGQGSR